MSFYNGNVHILMKIFCLTGIRIASRKIFCSMICMKCTFFFAEIALLAFYIISIISSEECKARGKFYQWNEY